LLAVGLLALSSGIALAQVNSGIKLDGDQPIQIESDKLEVRDAEAIAIFSGNVNVVQGATLLKAGKMTVYYVKEDGNGGATPTTSSQIDHLEVSDKVYLKSNDQVATGDAGSFDMKKNLMILTGKEVVLTQGGNIAKGCKLTVQTVTGQAQLESCGGRVQVQIQGSQSN
jgi:lipopolysaccharide export system protein LptA